MKIHLYTFGWNEMPMLGFFFRHYEPWESIDSCSSTTAPTTAPGNFF